jgi:hypothetical protein
MTRSILLFCLLSCILCSCGMSKYGLKDAWVFTEEKFRGNIQVDDAGNPVTKGVLIEMSIYLETKTQDLPSWTSVEMDGKRYEIKENKLVESPHTIGKTKADETPVILTAAPGNFLYRLVLESYDPGEAPAGIKEIMLNGETASGKVSIRIKKKTIPLLPQMVP